MIYSRYVPESEPAAAYDETERHVREHLSSVASTTDSPTEFADEVTITWRPEPFGTLIVGELNREPDAPYLRDDWDPEQDVADNPLTVPSILEGQ